VITRRVLVWCYGALSFVNVFCGLTAKSMASPVSIEFVTPVLLLGAQVMLELEEKGDTAAKG
jgi:hypothetical protein